MATKVFLSWGGDLSCKLAGALKDWLPVAFQFVKPYFTPDDVTKGTKWNAEISNELQTSDVGIICLTRDNTERPWILFEAGALSKKTDKSHVCTLLFGLEPNDLTGPLTSFQSTRFVKDDFRRLISTINSVAGDARLESAVVEKAFERWWPDLEKQTAQILSTHMQGEIQPPRTDREILDEILQLTRLWASQQSVGPDVQQPISRDVADIVRAAIRFVETTQSGDPHLVPVGPKMLADALKRLCAKTGQIEEYNEYATLVNERYLRNSGWKLECMT